MELIVLKNGVESSELKKAVLEKFIEHEDEEALKIKIRVASEKFTELCKAIKFLNDNCTLILTTKLSHRPEMVQPIIDILKTVNKEELDAFYHKLPVLRKYLSQLLNKKTNSYLKKA